MARSVLLNVTAHVYDATIFEHYQLAAIQRLKVLDYGSSCHVVLTTTLYF
jgi:hypothetical protein